MSQMISSDDEKCNRALAARVTDWCGLDVDHEGQCRSAPWRFDVLPEVPAHVTAMRDVCDTVWVRQLIDGLDLWLAWLGGEAVYETRQSLRYLASPATLPLVECPDPRAAS